MPGEDMWMKNGVSFVDGLFQQHVLQGGDPKVFNPRVVFEEKLRTFPVEEIPSLNEVSPHVLAPNTLVRFRGMIQDSLDPEMYLDTYLDGQTWKCGRYRDVTDNHSEVNFTDRSNTIKSRGTLYCVPIPGEASWAKDGYAQQSKAAAPLAETSGPSRSKRGRDNEEDTEMTVDSDGTQAMDTQAMEASISEVKRVATTEQHEGSQSGDTTVHSSVARRIELNLPIETEGNPCLVKVYEDDDFHVNDVVEIIGIFGVDVTLGIDAEACDPFLVEECKTRNPPASLIPRIHCIASRKMTHNNPLLPSVLEPQVISSIAASAPLARQLLVEQFTHACGGDELAANYLTLHMLARVFSRVETVVLGKHVLNVSNIKDENRATIDLVYELVKNLVPKSHKISMDLDTMNSTRMVPCKDHVSNKLLSGALQLSAGTHLILDETALQSGQLQNYGVPNAIALTQMIKAHTVSYDFEFSRIDYPVDLPTIVFSEGKSMFPVDAQIRVMPTTQPTLKAMTEEQMNLLRGYLGALAHAPYDISEEVRLTIQQDFVQMRQANKEVNGETLHSLLVLCRLHAISKGENSPSPQTWTEVKSMEEAAQARLPAAPAAPVAAPV